MGVSIRVCGCRIQSFWHRKIAVFRQLGLNHSVSFSRYHLFNWQSYCRSPNERISFLMDFIKELQIQKSCILSYEYFPCCYLFFSFYCCWRTFFLVFFFLYLIFLKFVLNNLFFVSSFLPFFILGDLIICLAPSKITTEERHVSIISKNHSAHTVSLLIHHSNRSWQMIVFVQ